MAKESSNGLMVEFMKESSKVMKKMDMELWYGLQKKNIKECGKKICLMDKEFLLMKNKIKNKAFGIKENLSKPQRISLFYLIISE